MAEAQIPEGVSADTENAAVRDAIVALHAAPDYQLLAAVLTALRAGFLIVDVTGTPKKQATRTRTTRSTTGQLILPIFTSMNELRAAVPKAKAEAARGAIMPAKAALRLIRSGRFVAAQINPGSATELVIVRKYVELSLGDEPIDASTLEAMK
jgi:hypothetical protein